MSTKKDGAWTGPEGNGLKARKTGGPQARRDIERRFHEAGGGRPHVLI